MPLDDVRAVLDAPDDAARDAAIRDPPPAHGGAARGHAARRSRRCAPCSSTAARRATCRSGACPCDAALAVAGSGGVRRRRGVARTRVRGAARRGARDGGGRATGPDGALYHDELFQQGEGMVVAFVPGRRAPAVGHAGSTDASLRRSSRPTELAVSLHVGPFEDLDQTYGALGAVPRGPRDRRPRGRCASTTSTPSPTRGRAPRCAGPSSRSPTPVAATRSATMTAPRPHRGSRCSTRRSAPAGSRGVAARDRRHPAPRGPTPTRPGARMHDRFPDADEATPPRHGAARDRRHARAAGRSSAPTSPRSSST